MAVAVEVAPAPPGNQEQAMQDMSPELHYLRLMIREDMKQLLKMQLGNPSHNLGSSSVSKAISQASMGDRMSSRASLIGSEDAPLPPTRASKMMQSIYNKIRQSRDNYYQIEDETQQLLKTVESSTKEGTCPRKLAAGVRWLRDLQEPPREGYLADLVRGSCFNGFFSSLILLNAIFMVFQVNEGIGCVGSDLDLPPHMEAIDNAFVGLFCVELVVKLIVHRLYFFWCPEMQWNVLDFGLVVYSVTELIIHTVVGGRGGGPTWMRSLRLFRVAKVLRILRVVRIFKKLELIMTCLMGSFSALLWSGLMLFIMYYVFSITLAQQTLSYLSELQDGQDSEQLLNSFGSVQSIMWALCKTTFGADGWDLYFPLTNQIGITAELVWIFYVVFTQIAVMNILTGIFVESALVLAQGTAQEKAREHETHLMEDAAELRKLCEAFDIGEKDGKLSQDEFNEMLKSHEFTTYLHYIGMDTTHIQDLFDVIAADESGRPEDGVEVRTIVSGILQLKGWARSSDLIVLMKEIQALEAEQARSGRKVAQEIAELRRCMEDRNLIFS